MTAHPASPHTNPERAGFGAAVSADPAGWQETADYPAGPSSRLEKMTARKDPLTVRNRRSNPPPMEAWPRMRVTGISAPHLWAFARRAPSPGGVTLSKCVIPLTPPGAGVPVPGALLKGNTMTKDYYGTKRVTAWPERKDASSADSESGYAVKYADGYISWSPKETFEAAYQPITAMSFAGALEAIKTGHRLARAGWNGKDMFVFLVAGSTFKVNRPPLLGIYPEGTEINYHGHIDMRTADGMVVPWLASQTDVLADDWCIVEDERPQTESA